MKLCHLTFSFFVNYIFFLKKKKGKKGRGIYFFVFDKHFVVASLYFIKQAVFPEISPVPTLLP